MMAVHSLTREQTRAVRAVMRLFADEDLARGVARSARRLCERCRHLRRAAGFIQYGATALCNPCATAYELARLRHAADPEQPFGGEAIEQRIAEAAHV